MNSTLFSPLTGSVIVGISLSLDKRIVRIQTAGPAEFHYFKAMHECCNHVWFEHINGIELLPANVIGAEDKDWQLLNSEDGDYLYKCSFVINTNFGRIDFELRNSTNGYYGGYAEQLDQDDIRDLLEDPPIFIDLTESI